MKEKDFQSQILDSARWNYPHGLFYHIDVGGVDQNYNPNRAAAGHPDLVMFFPRYKSNPPQLAFVELKCTKTNFASLQDSQVAWKDKANSIGLNYFVLVNFEKTKSVGFFANPSTKKLHIEEANRILPNIEFAVQHIEEIVNKKRTI